MNWVAADPQAPATARYHHKAIDEIIQCVQEGVYCAVLGPRLSGKTVLLRFVKRLLSETQGWTCVYVDLTEMRASTLNEFFADLIRLTGEQFSRLTGTMPSLPEDSLISSAVFRAFLADCVEALGSDWVMMIDNLEEVPTDLVQALLTSLRAAYMDQQGHDHRVAVVVSGALSLATLTVGESSPFRGIARRVFIGDLSNSQSQALIEEYLEAGEVSATQMALRRLLDATSGDHYLIRKMAGRCVELVHASSLSRLGSRSVSRILSQFLRQDVLQYAPLLDAVRLIEEDPDLLSCILILLDREIVPRSELPLPLSPDLDPLYLTGVVERVQGDSYRLQNLIYRSFLAEYFYPGRVGHMLAMAGRWDSAIDYLEAGLNDGDEDSRTDLLPATINSMHAAEDLNQAAHFLARGLSAAFGVGQVQVWYAPPQENCLRLIGGLGGFEEDASWAHHEMPLGVDRLEARAYRQATPLRAGESQGRIWRAIPLMIPGRAPLGVVMLHEDQFPKTFSQQRERELQILGYLNQAARAIQAVSTRRQELALAGRMQASLLPESLPEISGWGLAAVWRPARETSGDFYDFIPLPAGRLGIVIADVVDKGIGAALYMALSRTLIRTYAADYPDRPELVLGAANHRILAEAEVGQFVTAFYAILDPTTGDLVYCNAGHNPPYLQSAGSIEVLHRTGMALGVSEEPDWESRRIVLIPGSALLMYTDGLVDAQTPGGEPFGLQRLLEFAQQGVDRSARDLLESLINGVYAFAGGSPQVDDITLVVVRRDS